MMDRGAAGGCGVEEMPFPISRSPASIPARGSECGGVAGQIIDLFSQAAKALIERSPFDVAPSDKDGGQGSGSGVTTLPAELTGLLTKYTYGRRRYKTLHSGVDSKKKASIRQKRFGTIWIESEVYFRELKLADIETLFHLSNFLTSVCTRCLAIPEIGDAVVTDGLLCANVAAHLSGVEASLAADTVSATNKCGNEMVTNGLSGDSASSGRIGDNMASDGVAGNIVAATGMGDKQMTSVGASSDSDSATCRSGDEVVSVEFLSGNVVAVGGSGDDMVVDSERVMEKNDMQETGDDGCDVDPPHSSPSSSVSVEWVLGSKNKILLASERPSKKRRLLGENVGFEKLIISQPCEGNPNLCHFCSQGGNESEPSNRLIVCSTCSVAVQRKCYGVEENDTVDSTWLCSWCKHVSKFGEVAVRHMGGDRKPCLLCPKQGGALKPLKTNEAGNFGYVKFAHLFCSQWMPEVFVEDTKLMVPIVNVNGIKGLKLICSICKVTYGACVRFSYGMAYN